MTNRAAAQHDGANTSATDEAGRSKARRRGIIATALLPITGLAALIGKLVSRSPAELGSAATLGHEVASGLATGATATGATASGITAAGAAGTGASTATGAGAGGAGTGAAGATPPPAQGSIAQVAGVGAAATAVVVTVVAVMALTGDPEPVVEEPPPPAPVVTNAPEPDQGAPSAAPGLFAVDAAGSIDDNLLSGATGTSSTNPLIVTAVGGSAANVGSPLVLPSGATITVAEDGTFRYEPNDAFRSLGSGETATEEFVYTVADGTGWTAKWTAVVTISGVNDPPVLADPAPLSVGEEATGSISLSASDPDPDQLTITLGEGAPAFVTLVDAGDGTATITVAPGSGAAGSHEVAVTVTDDGNPPASATVTVSITVTAGESLARVTDGLLALYEFDDGGGGNVADTSGAGEPLDLIVADPGAVAWTGGSLELQTPTILRSAGPATKIIEAAAAANEVTVEAWVTPASTTQSGPARVVSVSDGIGDRNVTLGQGGPEGTPGDHWVGRLRTTETSANGLPSVATPVGTATAALTHVIYTRDASGAVSLYVDGVVQANGTVAGDLSSWDPSYGLLIGDEVGGGRHWLGSLHLVAVYGRALSPAEVDINLRVGPAGD